jgi:hypothetical protein
MITRTVILIDASRNVLATARVADEGPHYGGTIDLGSTPPALRALFDEFEEVVNDQVFSLVDEIQSKIDLQVFPSTGAVSFKVVRSPAHGAKSA